MREFAESEIVIPDGPFEGRRYSCDRQPYSRLWFDAVASPYWRRFVATGPTQSGKSLTCFVIPTLYHLFEVGETVICGLPSMEMAADKWNEDLLPAIERSRYRDLLPRTGAGSKGGTSNLTAVRFNNGVTLRFMSGGGGDKSRAGFTARVLVVTETDGLDESGGGSREADKLTQLEGRTRAYDDRAIMYAECTVSIEAGRTWQEYTKGTYSRIAIRCSHCARFVTPEREHLSGWQDAADILAAAEKAAFVCPECGQVWSEDDRRTANTNGILIHRGQEIAEDGTVTGPMPRTNTLGFRWTATNNLLVKSAKIAQDEWRASRSGNEENAEKEMRQFVWALPHKPATVDLTTLDHNAIMKQVNKDLPKGVCPPDTVHLTIGIDVGKWLCHWTAIAWRPNATPHVVEYGRLDVPSREMAEERAIYNALCAFRDSVVNEGWACGSERKKPAIVLVDSRYMKSATFPFCDESKTPYFPSQGYGTTQRHAEKFVRRSREKCVGIGDEYQIINRPGGVLVEINVDFWKSWLHARLQTPSGQPGSLTLYRPAEQVEHLGFAKHLTAEKKIEDFEHGRGTITRWHMLSRNNHWFDASALACVAGHAAGVRMMGQQQEQPPASAGNTNAEQPETDNWVTGYKGRW